MIGEFVSCSYYLGVSLIASYQVNLVLVWDKYSFFKLQVFILVLDFVYFGSLFASFIHSCNKHLNEYLLTARLTLGAGV